MEMIIRQGMNPQQKRDLDILTARVRMFLERWYK